MQLWKINKQTRTPLWGSTAFLSEFPFMAEYLQSFSRIDRDFIAQKGFLQPIWNTQYEDTDTEVLIQFKEDVENLILRNQNTYQRLYTLTKQEYNPIENYDRQEDGHDTTKDDNRRTSSYGEGTEHYDYGGRTVSNNFGGQTQTNDYGTQSESMNYGAQSATTNFGAQTQTNKYGGQMQTDTHGAQTQTTNHGGHSDSHVVGAQSTNTTHNIAGFNGGLEAESSDSVSAGSRTDNDTIGAYSDSTSSNSFTDTSATNEHTDIQSIAGRSDTSNTTAYIDTHTRNNFTDTQSTAAHTDTTTENARSDVHTTEAKEDVHVDANVSASNHTARIHGNIGVTTTAQMIEGERQLWSAFNFYKTIYNDIAKELCVYCDEGIDAFYAGFNDLEEEEEMVVIGNDQIRASVEQTPDGAIITITDSTGTSSAKISNGTDGQNGTNGKDGVTPKFKVEDNGDLYVDYSGQQEV